MFDEKLSDDNTALLISAFHLAVVVQMHHRLGVGLAYGRSRLYGSYVHAIPQPTRMCWLSTTRRQDAATAIHNQMAASSCNILSLLYDRWCFSQALLSGAAATQGDKMALPPSDYWPYDEGFDSGAESDRGSDVTVMSD